MRVQGKRHNTRRGGSSGLAALAALLLLWEILGRILESRAGLVPSPSRIILEIYREGRLLKEHTLATATELCAGVLIAVVLALAIGIADASARQAGRKLERIVAAFPVAPLIAAVPLLSLWFGFGFGGKLAAASLLGILPMLNHVMKACRAAPDGPLQLARLAGAPASVVFRKIRLPEALPAVLAGLRDCVAFSLAGAIAAEFIVAHRGLGYMLLASSTAMDIPLLFAGMTMIAALFLACLGVVSLLRRALAPWCIAER
jgi:ABC-type nitrate/sulfonate/bicarbonate transport system permease component